MIRIGILTYFASINYGAFLQAYALQKCLENRYEHIAEVEIIDYDAKIAHDYYLNRITRFGVTAADKLSKQYEAFIQDRKRLTLSKDKLISDNLDEVRQFLQGKYDIIIAGSDQIWKTDSFRGFPTAYWLNFDLGETVYMAYAVSGRNSYEEMSWDKQEYIRNSLKRFVYIGTRDEVTRKELLKIDSKIGIQRNCDPCFLMPQLFKVSDADKKKIRERYGISDGQTMISIMMQNINAGNRLHKMMRYDNKVLCLYNVNGNMRENNPVEVSPFEWSSLIAVSDLVITDYFHGTVFSILHHVPFVSIEGREKGRGKVENLLLENDMKDKFVYQSDYNGNNRALAIDLYTIGRKVIKDYTPDIVERAITREMQKSNTFFAKLDNVIDTIKM